MAGPEVVSKDTLDGLRSLLGVVEGKEEGDRAVWRVRVAPLPMFQVFESFRSGN